MLASPVVELESGVVGTRAPVQRVSRASIGDGAVTPWRPTGSRIAAELGR